MEGDNLRTASFYINNQLLSRGLLRNGQSIEFARPDKADGGLETTMGRVMSVVNDLILRRDRDAEQREAMAQTIRALRADALRQTTDLERVTGKHVEAQRRLGIAEATERALKVQLRSAENAARGLKEELGRMRVLVGQTRAQCVNDVRKRERVIEGMKKHVGEGGRARGSSKAVGVVSITVVAGTGAEVGSAGAVGTDDTGYDLRMETNEFLTELARGLSEENENLGGLVRRTVDTLKSLSGCESADLPETRMVVQVDMGYENLASEMDFVIEHLRTLLTNPSFVPLEEVEVREEEIIRLREGWEKMESRWREAMQMMDGWRKRMARSGQTVNLEELKMGLLLSPLKPRELQESGKALQLSTLEEEGEGDTQADIDAMELEMGVPPEPDFDDEDSDVSESSLFEEDPVEETPEEVSEEQQPEEANKRQAASSNSSNSHTPLSPLRETTNGNRGTSHPQTETFATITEENSSDLLQLDVPSTAKSKPTPKSHQRQNTSRPVACPSDEVSLIKTSNTRQEASPSKNSNPTPKPCSTPRLQTNTSSRLPRPRENVLPEQSPLTMASIAAKLAATEREADAARVRAKIKAARRNRAIPAIASSNADATKLMPPPPKKEGEDREPSKENAALPRAEDGDGIGTRKRKATGRNQGGRANRRRSTLSPWELESLISGGISESPVKGVGG